MARGCHERGFCAIADMSPDGIGGMVQLGARAESELNMLALSLGRSAISDVDCAMELAGRHLLFTLTLRGGQIYTAAALLDDIAGPQTLLRCPDTAQGWATIHRLIAAMETHAVKSLTCPIEVGTPGEDNARYTASLHPFIAVTRWQTNKTKTLTNVFRFRNSPGLSCGRRATPQPPERRWCARDGPRNPP